MSKRNLENLLFSEWLAAATNGTCFLTAYWYLRTPTKEKEKFRQEIGRRFRICRARWINGEDPTETYSHNQFSFGDMEKNFV